MTLRLWQITYSHRESRAYRRNQNMHVAAPTIERAIQIAERALATEGKEDIVVWSAAHRGPVDIVDEDRP